MVNVDTDELTTKVKDVYRQVAEQPHGAFHFEMGPALAVRLGYDPALLDQVPTRALESFAGVGYFFDLADLKPGDRVLDLGSGSGTDAFYASLLVQPDGAVVGVDFTAEQLQKASELARAPRTGAPVEFREGRIEDVPAPDADFDCVISNGVINLSADKGRVFAEAARVLRPGGRLAVADIVTEEQLTDAIVGDVDLWASCIGGAAQQDTYRRLIEAAGLRIVEVRRNPYAFLSRQALAASEKYGVMSISLLATK